MDDRERLQRYLEWRERTDRPAQRAVRRRRVRSALGVVAAGALGVTAFVWVSHDTRHAAPPAPASAPSIASPVIERAPAAPPASTPAVRRTARATVRTPARVIAMRERARSEPADEPPTPSAAPSERVASAEAATSAPTVVIATPSAPPSPAAAAPTPPPVPTVTAVPQMPAPAQDVVVVENAPVAQTPGTIAPGTVTSITSKPDCERAGDCVGGWLKGESREFTDGVKRQVDDFRSGVDRVGRGLQWLGSKLRRPE